MSQPSTLTPVHLAPLVQRIRHENVIIDSDLAELYGVEAKVLNQAVKRNIERFPVDFMFRLTPEEFTDLRRSSEKVDGSLRSQIVTPKDPRGGRLPPLRLHRAGRGHAFQCAALTPRGGGEYRDHADFRAVEAADGFQSRSGGADRGDGAKIR